MTVVCDSQTTFPQSRPLIYRLLFYSSYCSECYKPGVGCHRPGGRMWWPWSVTHRPLYHKRSLSTQTTFSIHHIVLFATDQGVECHRPGGKMWWPWSVTHRPLFHNRGLWSTDYFSIHHIVLCAIDQGVYIVLCATDQGWDQFSTRSATHRLKPSRHRTFCFYWQHN